MARSRSPKFPRYSLEKAIDYARAIFEEDRRNPIAREVVAKHMGYSGLSGAADKSIGTLNQYDLLERSAKGEVRLSQIAADILIPDNEQQRIDAIKKAAAAPEVFKQIDERFSSRTPSDEALRNYLLRAEYGDEGVQAISKAYRETKAYLARELANDSGRNGTESEEESDLSDEVDPRDVVGVGDLIQWESQGALQFESPRRVRAVSEDGQWVCVEGSETWIPMEQVILETKQPAVPQTRTPPPPLPITHERGEVLLGKNERVLDAGQLSKAGASYKVIVSGEIGVREIETLIKKLEISKEWLADDPTPSPGFLDPFGMTKP